MERPWLLAGDLGGTHTRLWLRSPAGRLHRHETPSGSKKRFLETLRRTLQIVPPAARPRLVAVLAVAGPVQMDRVELTNLGWCLDARALRRETGIGTLQLLHDVSAAAHGIPRAPTPHTLVGPPIVHHTTTAPMLLVMVGTGIGAALRLAQDILPTEAGHMAFAPRTSRQRRFLAWLRTEGWPLPTWETVAAGPALSQWYRFLEEEGVQADATVAAAFERSEDPAALVGRAASRGRCPRAVESVHQQQEALGHGLRDLALAFLPRGGILLGGGVLHHLGTSWQRADRFRSAYLAEAPLAPLVRTIPVGWLDDPDLGLRGAMARAEALATGATPCDAPC